MQLVGQFPRSEEGDRRRPRCALQRVTPSRIAPFRKFRSESPILETSGRKLPNRNLLPCRSSRRHWPRTASADAPKKARFYLKKPIGESLSAGHSHAAAGRTTWHHARCDCPGLVKFLKSNPELLGETHNGLYDAATLLGRRGTSKLP